MTIKKIVFLILVINSSLLHAQKLDVKYLDSFPDFSFLENEIKDSRIVLLGERAHSDYTTKEQKLKVIKYLHENMGFDVILLENFIFEIYLLNKSVKLNDSTLFKDMMCKVSRRDCDSLLFNGLMTLPKLEKQGLDYHYFEELFLVELDTIIDKHGLSVTDELYKFKKEYRFIVENKNDINRKRFKLLKKATFNLINELEKQMISLDIKQSNDLKQVLQILVNCVNSYEWMLKRPNKFKSFNFLNLRDELILENINWYLNRFYPNKKVIISTSTYHFTRKKEINSLSLSILRSKPMATNLYKQFGNDIYNIAFVAYKGQTGYFPKIDSLGRKKAKSIEKMVYEKNTKSPFAYVNLNKSVFYRLYLDATYRKSLKAKWYNIYDGLFYIRNMKTSKYISCEW